MYFLSPDVRPNKKTNKEMQKKHATVTITTLLRDGGMVIKTKKGRTEERTATSITLKTTSLKNNKTGKFTIFFNNMRRSRKHEIDKKIATTIVQ